MDLFNLLDQWDLELKEQQKTCPSEKLATFHSAVKSLKSKLVSLIMTLKGIPKIDKNKTTSINS